MLNSFLSFTEAAANLQMPAEIFSKPDVDGGLIGGASLKKEDFVAIVEAV